MSKEPTILILDDDEKWLALHERRLAQAGLHCFATQSAKEAIRVGKTCSSIKFALIDEILIVPPIPVDEKHWELQDWQGSGVVREINAQRSDLQFIMVTSAPQLRSHGDSQLLIREEAKLRRQRGVIDLIHKQEIDEDPDQVYGWLNQLLKQPQSSNQSEVLKPRLLVGLGIPGEILNGRKFQRLRQCLKDAGASDYELKDAVARFLAQLQPLEKTVFIEMPGSKKLERSRIKADSQAFHILEILAQRSEQKTDVIIHEQDYQYSPRTSSDKDVRPAPDLDQRSVKDFAFGYDENHRKSLRSGVQIEGAEQGSRLKVAIHRLSQQLARLNVGSTRQLFSAEQGGYRPLFETGVILYAVDSLKSRPK